MTTSRHHPQLYMVPAAFTAADLIICGQNTCLGQENVMLIYRLFEPHNLGDMDLVSNFKTLPKILCYMLTNQEHDTFGRKEGFYILYFLQIRIMCSQGNQPAAFWLSELKKVICSFVFFKHVVVYRKLYNQMSLGTQALRYKGIRLLKEKMARILNDSEYGKHVVVSFVGLKRRT